MAGWRSTARNALDRVVRAPIRQRQEPESRQMHPSEARPIYDAWASAHPDRMRRDDKRWDYWNWHYRVCTTYQDGYLCHEVNVLREALFGLALILVLMFRPLGILGDMRRDRLMGRIHGR